MSGDSAMSSVNMTFFDNFIPSLKAGQYTITVAQTLTKESGTKDLPSTPQDPVSQTFIVRGPRFILSPADVHRVFPPENGAGDYDQYLPMIVLNKRALPWERELETGLDDQDSYPWMALLVFQDDELLTPQPPAEGTNSPPGSQQNPTCSASFPLNNVVNTTNGVPTSGPPADTLGPTISLETDEDPNTTYCNVIDITVKTFTALIPTLKDMRFLAHVRQVSTENKEPLNIKHDSWFSTVIANRFAVPPATNGNRQTNIAHLVSLEGLEQYLKDDPDDPPVLPSVFQKVRLISLYSWAFYCLDAPQENFRQLMLDLLAPESEQNTDLLLRFPISLTTPAPDPGAQQQVITRLQAGHIPLSYSLRSGEQTFAWYRGPLAPTVTASFMETNAISTADNPAAPRNVAEAMVYDPASGLFDQSYAVAFQTGRSLALSSKPFSTSLLQWRRDAHNVVDVLLELIRSPSLARSLQQKGILDANSNLTTVDVTDLGKLLDANIVSNAFQDFLATEFANSIAKQIGQSGGFTSQDQNQQPDNPSTPQPSVPADLINLMQHPTVESLLQQLSGLEVPVDGSAQFEPGLLPETIVPWLARLALLYGVPFNNLVPNAAMLPVESIRFFYIDPNWIDSLLDGALSVGMQSSRDSLFHQLMRDPLRRAVDDVLYKVRDQLRGVTTNNPLALGALAGFVLRSAGVVGWPGLETRAWSAADSVNPMKPLRLDRVAPSVLIGIFPDVPVKLEFNEPSEGLVFGYEDQGIALRYLPGTNGATSNNIGQAINPDNPIGWISSDDLRKTQRQLDILQPPLNIASALVPLLQGRFAEPQPTLSPASFAVEMVRVPEQMLFLPKIEDTL